MNKAPAWSRVPRHRSAVSLYDNGWRENASQELLVSYPQLGSKLAGLLDVESAVIDHEALTITITKDGVDTVIGTGELSDFIISQDDFIRFRAAIALRDPENSDVVSLTVDVGANQTLTAYVIYSDGSEDVLDLTEASVTLSEEGVVSFNQETGLVTALSPGEIQMVVSAFNLNAILDVVVESVVVVEQESRTEVVPFDTQRVDNAELPVGTEETSQVGVVGVRTIVEDVTYTDGVETGRVVVSNEITTPAVPEIIQVGTLVITTEEETRTEPVPFETQRVDNAELPVGTEEVSQQGVDGVRTIVELVTYHDGVEVDREVLSNDITTPAVPEIIQVGTLVEEPAPEE